MKKIFLFSFFIYFLFYLNCFSQLTDQNISNRNFSDTEPFIAVNPADENNLIAAWMGVTGTNVSILTKCSFDGGATWGNLYTLPHLSGNFTSADVSIAFNKNGTAFISYVDYKLILDSGYVRVAKSNNRGISWSNPVNCIDANDAADVPVDRPWITVDNSAGIFSGRIYIVTKSYYAATPPQKIWLTVSSDSGVTWTSIKQLDSPVKTGKLSNIMGTPAVGMDGAFYTAYISWDTSFSLFSRIICIKSTDGGNNFTPYVITIITSGSPQTDTLYQGSYSLSTNPSNANNLIFQTTSNSLGDLDVFVFSSEDGAITWSNNAIRINDDAINNGIGQDMSWGSFSPNGHYAVCWRDRRNGGIGSSAPFEIFTALSADGGSTFSSNFNLGSASSPVISLSKGNDFLGVALNNNELFANWSDRRTGNNQIFFREESISLLLPIKEFSVKNLPVEIYPNPTNGNILIKNISGFPYELNILNIMGRNVFQKNENKELQSLRLDLTNGIYFVKIISGTSVLFKKIIIQK